MTAAGNNPGSPVRSENAISPDPTPERWLKIKDVFGEALELDAAQRKRFLDQSCDGDLSLRREVESLLAASSDPTDNYPGTDGQHDPMIGRRLGAYEIRKLIGSGGMAAVYLGVRADDAYRKQVGIKIIHPSLEKEKLCRRFRHERQTLAALDHPNIVKLLDGGTTDEGLPYLVMDYVDGKPIDEYCEQHQLTIEQRLQLFRTVCAAVEHAHKKQVVHRDLKPSNILVTAEGVPKLLDFGIAKLLSPDEEEAGLLTITGQHHMTPAYASPEQVRGEPITCASDIYSLGVLLYLLLTGRRPYRFKNYTPAEVERVICESEAERPSTAVTRTEEDRSLADSSAQLITPQSASQARGTQLDKLQRSLRGDLDNIVLKALHKEANQRYGSAQEFSDDVERHLQDRPVKARPATFQYRAKKFIRRRKTEVAAACLVLIMAAALAYSFWKPASVQGNDSIAVVLLVSSSHPAPEFLKEGIQSGLIQTLSRISNLRVVAVTPKVDEDIDPQTIARSVQVNKVLTARITGDQDKVRLAVEVLDDHGTTKLWSQVFEFKTSEALDTQEQISREVVRRLTTATGRVVQPPKLSTKSPEAYQLFLQGRFNCEQRTSEGFRKGVQALRQALQMDPGYALAYAQLSSCLYSPGYYVAVDPKQIYPQAKNAARKAIELDNSLAEAHEALANGETFDFNWASAEGEFKLAIELNPNYSLAHFHYAIMLVSVGRWKEAVAEAQKGQDLQPTSPIMNAGLAWILAMAAQEDPKLLDQCLQQSRTNREIATAIALSYLDEGMCYEQKNMYPEAVAAFQKGIDVGGPLPVYKAFQGQAYARSGDKGKAREILAEFQTLSKQRYVSPSLFAMIYDGLGEKELELDALQKAYENRDTGVTYARLYIFKNLHADPRFQELARKVGVRQ